MNELTNASMALAIVAAVLLAAAGTKLALVRETRVRGALMIVAAVVLALNVAIWMI
jgi:hypothetical protein